MAGDVTGSAAAAFPALSRPLTVRGRTLANRLVMGPLCTMFAAPDGSATAQLVEYYRARAQGGVGTVIVEMTFIDDAGSRAFHAQLGAHNDLMIPGLGDLAEAIAGAGALAGIQLGHCGSQRVLGRPPILAPSAVAWAPGKPVPQAMTADEVERLIADFADAAGRCAAAGFDLIELHGAHGYIINAFLNPVTNVRGDRYGGSPENRLRLAQELIGRVRARIGPDRLLGIRLNGDDLMDGGLGPDDYAGVAQALVAAGVDLIHVSAGTYRAMELRVTPMYLPEAPFVDYAATIKAAVDVPVIAAGSIHTPDVAEAIVRDGKADLVAMSRPFLADAGLAGKILSGRTGAIVPCIRCNSCVAREQAGMRSYCAVNPESGHEWHPPAPAVAARRVLVAGGGPAGIQAALAAARRGHRVTLVERAGALGGQLRLAAAMPFKAPLRGWLDHAEAALADAGVTVMLGADLADSGAPHMDADVLIVATGPDWAAPSALAAAHPIGVIAALAAPAAVGRRVAVVGGTLAGAETAWHLATLGHAVTLVEAGVGFADDVNLIARIVLPRTLAAAGVDVRFTTRAVAAGIGRLRLDSADGSSGIEADTVIDAAPATAGGAPAFAARFGGAAVHVVGERAGRGGLYWASRTGAAAGNLV
ncbi:MAG: FAD-dependent oxidoreductase [Rhodospirillales bacterium]